MGKSGRPASKKPHSAPEETPEKRGEKGSGKKGFDNTNRGVLFQNDKDGNEARPDVTGKISIKIPDGAKPGSVVDFRLAGWNKESQSGKEFVSLVVDTFKPKEKTED
jgi:hypothetical protein